VAAAVKVLIFGTTFIDDELKLSLAEKWWKLHSAINPECDLLFVDSASPKQIHSPMIALQIGLNIGHLSRGGMDGWGRAFCIGLQYAIDNNYDYVAHIEGDSLCRLDVMSICTQMFHSGVDVLGIPVKGTKIEEKDWVETGLMFFDVAYLYDAKIAETYNWRDCEPKRVYPHVPEWHLRKILGDDLVWAEWRAIRDDRNMMVDPIEYDWITHTTPDAFDRFFAHNMPKVAA
jgi:hypothetical protein